MSGVAKGPGAVNTREGLPRRSLDRPFRQAAAIPGRQRGDVALQPGIPPPPDYYRNNLLRVLEHVRTVHSDLLASGEECFIHRFTAASRPAQRLYARLLSRKGPNIRLDKIAYREVPDVCGAVDELAAARLVLINAEAPADALLKMFTRDELASLFEARAPTRTALLADILGQHTDAAIRERLRRDTNWLCIAEGQYLDLVQLLFFGGPALGGPVGDLTTFVLEDLGTARFERYRVSRSQRLFNTRTELGRYLAVRRLNHLSQRAGEHPGVAGAVMSAIADFSTAPTRIEQRLLDRALNRLGRFYERAGAAEAALACYARSSAHPARERRVRILTRTGRKAAAKSLLHEIAARPAGPEEQDFAARFGRRRTLGTLPVTSVPLTERPAVRIESHALEWLRGSGGEGWHLENRLPLGLAGLAFWDVVFAPLDGAFLNPYQAGPLDLFWEDFAQQRAEALAAAAADLAEADRFARILKATHAEKAGIVNRLVSWGHLPGRLLDRILETVPHDVLFPLVCHVIENLWKARTGFPDLLVLYGTKDYEFVEVKGPGDQLQPAQRVWFDYFRENGCKARILKFKLAGSCGDQ